MPVLQAEESMVLLTRYSKTSVSDFGVCTISWRVTIFACFKSFKSDTKKKKVSIVGHHWDGKLQSF